MEILLRLILAALLLAFADARRLLGWPKKDGLEIIRPDDFFLKRFLDFYGASVSLSGDTLIVGAPYASNSGSGLFTGIAYVFVKTTGKGGWTEQARLNPNANLKSGSLFSSWNVALDGDTAIVGSLMNSEAENLAGAAYIYVRNSTEWSLQKQLMAPMPAFHDFYGLKVAIDEAAETAVVAAQYADNNATVPDSGKVFVYTRTGTDWNIQQTLEASDASQFAKFGSSIAIEGDSLVVGAPSDQEFSPGSAYYFTRAANTWTEQKIIVPDDLGSRGNFGDSVAISGNTIAIGDWGNTWTTGAIYVYTGSGSSWNPQQKLQSPKFIPLEFYSWSISLENDTLAAGGWLSNYLKGQLYIYKRTAGVWSEAKVVGGRTPAGLFGSSVSVDNGNIAVGAMMEGAAYYLDASNV